MEFTTVAEYSASEEACTGHFTGQDGEILAPESPITIDHDGGKWCAGHWDGNQTWEELS